MTDPNFHFETERLYICYFQPSDEHCDFLVKLYNTPQFIASEGLTAITSREAAHDRIAEEFRALHARLNYGQYLILLKASPAEPFSSPKNIPIGSVSFMRGPEDDPNSATLPDLGYCILPEFNGKGYATEAAKGLLKYGRENLGVKECWAFVGVGNEKSKGVAERCGLEYRGRWKLGMFGGKEDEVYAMPGMDKDLTVYGLGKQ